MVEKICRFTVECFQLVAAITHARVQGFILHNDRAGCGIAQSMLYLANFYCLHANPQ